MNIPKACGRARATPYGALLLAAFAILWACAPDGAEAPAERRRIIVELADGGPAVRSGAAGSAREVAERILSRLDPEIRESARVLDRLPFMALEADAVTLLKLMGMPEVASVAPDREVGVRVAPEDEATAK